MKVWQFALVPLFALNLLNLSHAQVPMLQGDWESVASEASGPIYATRAFHFEGDRWKVVFHAYADAGKNVPLFTLNVGGLFVIGDQSATVPGAYEGIFPARYRYITADSEAGVNFFAGMGCALRKDDERELISNGCGFVPSLMQAMGEYDLVSIRDEQLFFGDRSGDLTKARPSQLTPYPLRKVASK